jgi:hypothetical protein
MTTAIGTPSFLDAGSYTAEQMRLPFASLLPRLVGGNAGTSVAAQGGIVNPGDLAVAAGSGMNVTVAPGEAWVPGTYAPGAQAAYYGYSSAIQTLLLTGNASNPVVHLIVAAVNDQNYVTNPSTAGNNEWDIMIVAGTPAATPVIPTVPTNCLVLATVLLKTNPSSVASNGVIVQGLATAATATTLTAPIGQPTAETIGTPCGHMYCSTATVMTTAGTNYTATTTATILRSGVTWASNALYVPVAGVYQISAYCTFATSGGGVPSSNASFTPQFFQNGSLSRQWKVSGVGADNYPSGGGTSLVTAAAGDYFTLVGSSAANNEEILASASLSWLDVLLVSF